jgi:cytochrome c-type biogenesis protein CcmH/NrfF
MARGGTPIIRALIGLSTLLLVVAGCTKVADGPGQIELSATEFDFGTIPNDTPVSQTFQVRNVGEGWLEITGVSTSCGCTSAEVTPRRLAPGEAAELRVTYDPRVHGGEAGTFLRQVYIRSNDPETPEAVLTIHVTVAAPEDTVLTPTAEAVDAAILYKEFICPCCGQDIGSCTCEMAEERRATIDHILQYGGSPDLVYQAMFQAYGADAFFDPEQAEQARNGLLKTLPADRPILVAEPESVDLGRVPIDGGLVTLTFTLRNAGRSDLTLFGALTSCGCTTAVIETAEGVSPPFGANAAENPADWSAVLAPGEEVRMVVTFDPLFHGPEGTGRVRRTVSVLSDDPLSRRLDVTFEAEITE